MLYDDDTAPRPWMRIPASDRKFKRIKNLDSEMVHKVLEVLEEYPNYIDRPRILTKAVNDPRITVNVVRNIIEAYREPFLAYIRKKRK